MAPVVYSTAVHLRGVASRSVLCAYMRTRGADETGERREINPAVALFFLPPVLLDRKGERLMLICSAAVFTWLMTTGNFSSLNEFVNPTTQMPATGKWPE